MIARFRGPYDFLSNFHPAIVVLDGETYPTVEHAYQAAKFLDPARRAAIRTAARPGTAKRLGRRPGMRPNWEMLKIGVMRDLLEQKFAHPELRERLLATADQELQEGNLWGDRFWGVDLTTGAGDNRLGELLMELRDRLLLERRPRT